MFPDSFTVGSSPFHLRIAGGTGPPWQDYPSPYNSRERVGLPTEQLTNLAIYCALAGIAGAKLFMFLFDWRFYLQNPDQLFLGPPSKPPGCFTVD